MLDYNLTLSEEKDRCLACFILLRPLTISESNELVFKPLILSGFSVSVHFWYDTCNKLVGYTVGIEHKEVHCYHFTDERVGQRSDSSDKWGPSALYSSKVTIIAALEQISNNNQE